MSNEYSPEHQDGIVWNDPSLNISWPLTDVIVSDNDKKLPSLENLENSFE